MTSPEAQVDWDPTDVRKTLAVIYAATWPAHVLDVLLAPSGMGTTHTLESALDQIALPAGLLPLAIVDEASVAVVALKQIGKRTAAGSVLRWFLTTVHPKHQLALLDVDPLLYISSLDEELGSRAAGLDRMLDDIGPAYETTHLSQDKRPRDFIVRPVRIACQNVIVGLAAIAQDSSFDGLSVAAWQTCETPHVVTHEANRALAALTLCDAFQNGGTMEIRFDRPARIAKDGRSQDIGGHPEGAVPASLRRFARTVGVDVGGTDRAAITPHEARALFLAVTPMPARLLARVLDAVDRHGMTPERLCFTLLSQTWREVELDFILALSSRAGSILEGGCSWDRRSARQTEMEICREALMVGMLYRRLNSLEGNEPSDGAGPAEDLSVGVEWEVLPDIGAVRFDALQIGAALPWIEGVESSRSVTVLPRITVPPDLPELIARTEGAVALALPGDTRTSKLDLVPVLRCPDRTADLDRQVEAKLLTSRIARG